MSFHSRRRSGFAAALLITASLAFAGCDALPRNTAARASPPAEVVQRMGPATVRVVYGRPVARGRELFGALVPYDSVWNPGANEATYIQISEDMLVNGQPLGRGSYSIWAIPRPDEWTVIFSHDWNTFHIPYPQGRDALRLNVRPVEGPHMESMNFYFPFAERTEGTLHLHWGEVVVPFELRLAGAR
jgi:hypothetical protein